MLWFLTVLCIHLTLCVHPSTWSEIPNAKIISGWETSIRDASFVTLDIEFINPNDKSPYDMFCDSTIIVRQWVISAAHCILDEFKVTNRVSLIMGMDELLHTKNMPQRNDDIPRLWHYHIQIIKMVSPITQKMIMMIYGQVMMFVYFELTTTYHSVNI